MIRRGGNRPILATPCCPATQVLMRLLLDDRELCAIEGVPINTAIRATVSLCA